MVASDCTGIAGAVIETAHDELATRMRDYAYDWRGLVTNVEPLAIDQKWTVDELVDVLKLDVGQEMTLRGEQIRRVL